MRSLVLVIGLAMGLTGCSCGPPPSGDVGVDAPDDDGGMDASMDGGPVDVGVDAPDADPDTPIDAPCEPVVERTCDGELTLRGSPLEVPRAEVRFGAGLMQRVGEGWVWPVLFRDPADDTHLSGLGLAQASGRFDRLDVATVEGVPFTDGDDVWSFVGRFAADRCGERVLLPLDGERGAPGFVPISTTTAAGLLRAGSPQPLEFVVGAFDGERIRALGRVDGDGTCGSGALVPMAIDLATLEVDAAPSVTTRGHGGAPSLAVLIGGTWWVWARVGCEPGGAPAILEIDVDGTTRGPRPITGLVDFGVPWTLVILPRGGGMAVAFVPAAPERVEVWVAAVDLVTGVADPARALDLGAARLDLSRPHIVAFEQESATTMGWLYVDRSGPAAQLVLVRFRLDGTVVQRMPLPALVTEGSSSFVFRWIGSGYVVGYLSTTGWLLDVVECAEAS